LISRAEYDQACAGHAAAGAPLQTDRAAAWRVFAGWRVKDDAVLLALAQVMSAPIAPWTSFRLPLIWTRPSVTARHPPALLRSEN
jgi:hypothetical protein